MDFTPEVLGMRWGYGLPLPQHAPRDRAAMLALLSGPDRAAGIGRVATMAEVVPLLDALRLKKKPSKSDPALRPEVAGIEKALSGAMYDGLRATIARALDSPDGFRERLVQFWADHFTTTTRSQFFALYPLIQVDEAIRPHLTGRFADLLTAAVLHPAMLTYLDQTESMGPTSPAGQRRGKGLNENLARELLELHTLGAGAPYRQADVYQLAELLTGLGFGIKEGGAFFDPRRVEPGPEWVLGRKYDGEGLAPIHAVLADLAARPETAAHIARKLVVHFITDSPDPAEVATVERAFLDSGGDLMAVYAALLSLPSAGSPVPGKVRQPLDFVIAAFRALGLRGADLDGIDNKTLRRGLVEALAAMGQPFKAPRGPDGAPEEAAAWITPQGLAARLQWALRLARQKRPVPLPDPAALARLALGARADEALIRAASRAEDRAEGVALVLLSPAFNRR